MPFVVVDQNQILEKKKPLSKSLLWRLQRRFFNNAGIEAWREGIVPHYITSNPFIANAYAKVVLGFLKDFQSFDPNQPIYILELGAGSGRFAYMFIKRFFEHILPVSKLDLKVKYVLTDFVERNIEFWQSHPSLLPYVEKGFLDFARFDLEKDSKLKLINSNLEISSGSLKNPLIVLANYVFDGVPQDIFEIRNKQLFECLATLISTQKELDKLDPEILNHSHISYDMLPCSTKYYQDPIANNVLEQYCKTLPDTKLVFPISAIKCFNNLQALSNNLMILTGDKGHTEQTDLINQNMPTLATHGSFSMTVNYHALKLYVEQKDWQVFHINRTHNSLNIVAFCHKKEPNCLLELSKTYQDTIEYFGPDDFFALKKAFERNHQNCTIEELVTFLRTSLWDANIIIIFYPSLLSLLKTESISEWLKLEFKQGFRQSWDLYYQMGEKKNFAYYLGSLSTLLDQYDKAEFYFEQALEYGADPKLTHNLAVCYYHLNKLESKLKEVEDKLEKEPNNEIAKLLQSELQQAIEFREEHKA